MQETSDIPVLAIDGPSGSGKGTVAHRLAERLGWHLLDSGAIYRLLALAALEKGVSPDDEDAIIRLADEVAMDFRSDLGSMVEALLDGRPAGERLRSEACGEAASRLASLPRVRQALLARQRAFRRPPGLVADGRDMGTVVFPDAVLKIFLNASAEERARRRHNQLKEKGLDANLSHLLREIRVRDERDVGRAVSPLAPAPDAVTLDSTDLTVEQVADEVHSLLASRLPGLPGPATG